MVEPTLTEGGDGAAMERALALGYAPPGRRAALAALFDLDATLAQVLRTTRDPLLGQMRLTWWHEALGRLDKARPPAEPVLQALAAEALPAGVKGAAMAELVLGWEALLDDPVNAAAITAHGVERGGRLFALAATALGRPDNEAKVAGEGWALADLARHLNDPVLSAQAADRARERLGQMRAGRWPRVLRSLGAMAQLARHDLRVPFGETPPFGSPRRVLALLRMRLFGY